jgi:hypothetical protein
MIYVVMRRDRYQETVQAIAAFNSHMDAYNYANSIDDGNEKYAYRIDSVHLNPTTDAE